MATFSIRKREDGWWLRLTNGQDRASAVVDAPQVAQTLRDQALAAGYPTGHPVSDRRSLPHVRAALEREPTFSHPPHRHDRVNVSVRGATGERWHVGRVLRWHEAPVGLVFQPAEDSAAALSDEEMAGLVRLARSVI